MTTTLKDTQCAGGVWAYVRSSTKEAAGEASLRQQLQWAEAFADFYGRELRVFVDRLPAGSADPNSQYLRMLGLIEEGRFAPEFVVVTSVDRLCRDNEQLARFAAAMAKARVKFYTKDSGAIDLYALAPKPTENGPGATR